MFCKNVLKHKKIFFGISCLKILIYCQQSNLKFFCQRSWSRSKKTTCNPLTLSESEYKKFIASLQPEVKIEEKIMPLPNLKWNQIKHIGTNLESRIFQDDPSSTWEKYTATTWMGYSKGFWPWWIIDRVFGIFHFYLPRGESGGISVSSVHWARIWFEDTSLKLVQKYAAFWR